MATSDTLRYFTLLKDFISLVFYGKWNKVYLSRLNMFWIFPTDAIQPYHILEHNHAFIQNKHDPRLQSA